MSSMIGTGDHSDASYFDVVAIAASAGGFGPLIEIISSLPADFPASVLVVLHTGPGSRLAEVLSVRTQLEVKEAEDGDRLNRAIVYTAKPGKHLMVNSDGTLSYGSAEPVQFTKPAADVLLVTLAISYRDKAIAVILSSAGKDGAIGALAIKRAGGKSIAQEDPEFPGMPEAAIKIDNVDFVLPLAKIAPLLIDL